MRACEAVLEKSTELTDAESQAVRKMMERVSRKLLSDDDKDA
jgi:hypothetical protein